jgi:Flp pilus assembly protein TadG
MTRRGNRGRRGQAQVSRRDPRRSDRGAAAVEFAMVAPLLLMLVFGIVDFGMLIQTKTSIGNAAYEGARNGSISHSEAAIDTAVKSSLGDLATDAIITVTCTGPAPTYTACPAGGLDANVASGGTISVTVQYHYDWKTPMPSLIGLGDDGGIDVTETAEMRVE